MALAQPLNTIGADRESGFAKKLIGEQPSAHADLAVDAPYGQLDPLGVESLLPGQHMLIDAVDERAVEVEKENGLDTHWETSPSPGSRGSKIPTFPIVTIASNRRTPACRVGDDQSLDGPGRWSQVQPEQGADRVSNCLKCPYRPCGVAL
jgi:hypothetical protein